MQAIAWNTDKAMPIWVNYKGSISHESLMARNFWSNVIVFSRVSWFQQIAATDDVVVNSYAEYDVFLGGVLRDLVRSLD